MDLPGLSRRTVDWTTLWTYCTPASFALFPFLKSRWLNLYTSVDVSSFTISFQLTFFLTQWKEDKKSFQQHLGPSGKKLSNDLMVRWQYINDSPAWYFTEQKKKKIYSFWLMCCPLVCQNDFDIFIFYSFFFFQKYPLPPDSKDDMVERWHTKKH